MQANETLASPGPRLSPAAWARRRGLHYGWVMVAVTFVIVVAANGVRSAPSVLIKPLESDFGWSRGEISYALSLSLLTLGLAGPASGRITERYGIRTTVFAFLALTAAGVFLSATIGQLWQLHLFWGLLVGFGSGGVSVVLSATVANTWFEERRGLVTGVLGGAASAGQFAFLQLLIVLVHTWDWRVAILFLGLVLAVLLPVALLLVRSRPSDVGLTPYGVGSSTWAAATADTRVTPMSQALRTGDFWLLALSFAICGFTTIGLIGTHFIPHATQHGFTESQAAGLLTLMGVMNIFGTIGSGWLTDRYDPRKLLAFYYFTRASSLLVLPLITNLPLMSVFAIAFGLDYIATVPPTVMLTANRFGRRSVGSIYGWITFSHMAGGAIAGGPGRRHPRRRERLRDRHLPVGLPRSAGRCHGVQRAHPTPRAAGARTRSRVSCADGR